MRLADLERHLREHGCVFHRQGGAHAIWFNPKRRTIASVPRHRERSRKGRCALFAGSLKYLSPELPQGASVVSFAPVDSDSTVHPFFLPSPMRAFDSELDVCETAQVFSEQDRAGKPLAGWCAEYGSSLC